MSEPYEETEVIVAQTGHVTGEQDVYIIGCFLDGQIVLLKDL